MKNCLSCGAPLTADNPVCSYCGVLQPIDLSLLAPITIVEKQTPCLCPDCKIPLQSIRVSVKHDRAFHSCPQCYGLGVSTQELPAILDAMVQYVFHADTAMIDALVKAHPLKTTFHYRPCPMCGVLMNRHNSGERSAVIVDFCTKDDLTWFNDGDLQKLCEWRKAGGQILDAQVTEEHARQELQQELYRLQLRLEEDNVHNQVETPFGGRRSDVAGLWAVRAQADRMQEQIVREKLAQLGKPQTPVSPCDGYEAPHPEPGSASAPIDYDSLSPEDLKEKISQIKEKIARFQQAKP